MKKLFVMVSFAGLGLLASCGGGDTKNAETENRKDEAQAAAPAEPAKDPDYEKGLALVGQSDCFTCHKVSEAFVGPAYQAVADKYQKTDEVVNTLANKVIKGGSGNWGQVPMTAHPNLSLEDAKTMVKYVLSLKK